eukprot:264671-Chlamydomonas_euryale.AAC.1
MHAAWNGNAHCVHELLQHDPAAQVAAIDKHGETALMGAARNGYTQCVHELLQHDPAAQVAAVDNNGWTAL